MLQQQPVEACSTDFRPGERSSRPSTSNNSFNVRLMYENGAVQFRFSIAHVEHNLRAIRASRATDTVSVLCLRIDIGSNYLISRNLTPYCDAKNFPTRVGSSPRV